MERYPNLFLIGTPDAGTATMAALLARRPDVFCCEPAAPLHHCTDFPDLVALHGFSDDEDYLALFADAGTEHTVVVDASPAYLRSRIAVERIEAATARTAAYLVLLRRPAVSLGAAYAALCGDIERLLSQVPRGRVRFVDAARLDAEPATVVAEVAAWLELSEAVVDLSLAGRAADRSAMAGVTATTPEPPDDDVRRDIEYLELLTGLDLSGWARVPAPDAIVDLDVIDLRDLAELSYPTSVEQRRS